MTDQKKMLLVDAEALERATRKLRDMGEAFVHEPELRRFSAEKGLDPDDEARRIAKYVRALTPQPEGEAIPVEWPHEGSKPSKVDDAVVISGDWLEWQLSQLDELRAENVRLRAALLEIAEGDDNDDVERARRALGLEETR